MIKIIFKYYYILLIIFINDERKNIVLIKKIKEVCADLVNIHVEADTEEHNLEALRMIREQGKQCGITLKPKTTWEAVLPYLDITDLVLVMTVEPGFGGQHFMAEQMDKVRAIGRKSAQRLAFHVLALPDN